MGSFPISRQSTLEELANLVGVRTGLAWSEEELLTHVDRWVPEFRTDEWVRMRATTFENLTFDVLKASGDRATDLGERPRVVVGRQLGVARYARAHDLLHHEIHVQGLGPASYRHDVGECSSLDTSEHLAWVVSVHDHWISDADLERLDDDLFLGRVLTELGPEARADCALVLRAARYQAKLNPFGRVEHVENPDAVRVASLYERASTAGPRGGFFDQRLIDYLYANVEEVDRIHWRQFERLIAEYLLRQGYYVELGPGGNDDGIDIRMWPAEAEPGVAPLVIVQCKAKNARSRVDKVVVKALWADTAAYGAARGLVATTTWLSPGAQATIVGRGYGIDVVDRDAIPQLLETMRSPGTGLWLAD